VSHRAGQTSHVAKSPTSGLPGLCPYVRRIRKTELERCIAVLARGKEHVGQLGRQEKGIGPIDGQSEIRKVLTDKRRVSLCDEFERLTPSCSQTGRLLGLNSVGQENPSMPSIPQSAMPDVSPHSPIWGKLSRLWSPPSNSPTAPFEPDGFDGNVSPPPEEPDIRGVPGIVDSTPVLRRKFDNISRSVRA
jgi:hypothetical protein